MLTKALDFAADCYGPFLALLAILAPLFGRGSGPRRTLRYAAAAGGGVLFVYLVKFLDARFGWWQAANLDYSTHSAFAASLAVSLAFFRPRWSAPLAVSFIVYAAIVLLLFHRLGDILSSAILAGLFAAGAQTLARSRPTPDDLAYSAGGGRKRGAIRSTPPRGPSTGL